MPKNPPASLFARPVGLPRDPLWNPPEEVEFSPPSGKLHGKENEGELKAPQNEEEELPTSLPPQQEIYEVRKVLDLAGLRFFALEVLYYCGIESPGGALWVCSCVCGNALQMRSSALRHSKYAHCGCLEGLTKRAKIARVEEAWRKLDRQHLRAQELQTQYWSKGDPDQIHRELEEAFQKAHNRHLAAERTMERIRASELKSLRNSPLAAVASTFVDVEAKPSVQCARESLGRSWANLQFIIAAVKQFHPQLSRRISQSQQQEEEGHQ